MAKKKSKKKKSVDLLDFERFADEWLVLEAEGFEADRAVRHEHDGVAAGAVVAVEEGTD